jgi:ribose transport system substrate-binding protein
MRGWFFRIIVLLTLGHSAGLIVGCSASTPSSPPQNTAERTVTIGLIAKSQSNPVFQAARKGAMDAAAELAPRYGVKVAVRWETPPDEDAQAQADTVETLAQQGVDGIAISCSDASKVTNAIHDAVEKYGVAVVCFDSDAPKSGRFAYHGIDDVKCGERVMRTLAQELGGKGKVAVLAGNQTAPNLQRRVEGVKRVLPEFPEIELVDVFYHKETPQDAAAKVEQVMQAHPDLAGWAMVGGWALFTSNALPWAPGTVKCVSVDALPPMLTYLESGHVNVLLAQDVYRWGYRSIELLLDKVVHGKMPQNELDYSDLIPVTRENVAAFRDQWKKWLPQ